MKHFSRPAIYLGVVVILCSCVSPQTRRPSGSPFGSVPRGMGGGCTNCGAPSGPIHQDPNRPGPMPAPVPQGGVPASGALPGRGAATTPGGTTENKAEVEKIEIEYCKCLFKGQDWPMLSSFREVLKVEDKLELAEPITHESGGQFRVTIKFKDGKTVDVVNTQDKQPPSLVTLLSNLRQSLPKKPDTQAAK